MSAFKWGILGSGGIANDFARDLSFLDVHAPSIPRISLLHSMKVALPTEAMTSWFNQM